MPLFTANPQRSWKFSTQQEILRPLWSQSATERRVARKGAGYRSGMGGSALCDHSHRQAFSEADQLALLLFGAVTRISEATFTQ